MPAEAKGSKKVNAAGGSNAAGSMTADTSEWSPSDPAVAAARAELASSRVLPAPWWACHLGTRPPGWWLAAVDPAALEAQPGRRKVGFLNACERGEGNSRQPSWVGAQEELEDFLIFQSH